MEPKLVIGLMSGTSVDGIDACLVKMNPDFTFEYIDGLLYPYPKEVKDKIFQIFQGNINIEEICWLNFVIGHCFADATQALLKQANLTSDKVDLIGSHGQTIYHYPINDGIAGISKRSTLQIGDQSIIAKRTGIATIADFRPADIAVGGQGAPLVCYADERIFKNADLPKATRAIQNIGGMANVTVVGPNCETFAFDTGPGNVFINYFTQKFFDKAFDEDGKLALQGQIDDNWLDILMQDDYYLLNPPKTTGREYFSEKYAENILKFAPENPHDIITTITALTAKSIAKAYFDYVIPITPIDEIVLGGGGAYNPYLISLLEKYFSHKIPIKTHEDFGVSNKFKEAIAFAMLAYASYYDIPNNVPSCTGAIKRTVMGTYISGK